jgi:hypothetical protein
MKRVAKRILKPAYELARRLIREAVKDIITEATVDHDSLMQQVQRNIVNQYQSFRKAGMLPYAGIRDAGFRAYPQFEEDGVVEMCCGSAHECMATNLILNHGFDGYLFEAPELDGMIKEFAKNMNKSLQRRYRRRPNAACLVPSDLVASHARQVAQALASPRVRPLGLLPRMRRECFSPREGVVSQSFLHLRFSKLGRPGEAKAAQLLDHSGGLFAFSRAATGWTEAR